MTLQFHRPKDVAQKLGCSVATVYREAHRGKIVIAKIGSASVISEDELQRYARSLATKPAQNRAA